MTRYLVFTMALAWPLTLRAEKLPIPPDAVLERPVALIKEVYGREHSNAKTNEELQALAKKLFSVASKTDKPIERYALLRVARDIATQACDGQTAFQTIDEMDRTYLVDALRMKASVLRSLAQKARVPADRKSVAEQTIALADQAVAQDDYEMSSKLAEMALSEARKLGHTAYVKSVAARSGEIGRYRKAYAEVRAAAEKLAQDPTDPEANLAVGRHRCLVKGDWESGLPMLALSSDATLKALAIADLEGASVCADQAKLGDAWWDVAEKGKGDDQETAPGASGIVVREGDAGVDGAAREKVARRLKTETENLHVVRFDSSAHLNSIIADKSKCGLANGKLITKTPVLYSVYFDAIESVTIRGGIVPPGKLNFRASVGPINMILNWEGADNNLLRHAERKVKGSTHHRTSPRVLTPGRIHEIVVKQVGDDILVLIDGQTHYKTSGKRLFGTICVYPRKDALMIQDIVIKGNADKTRRVTEPSHGNLY